MLAADDPRPTHQWPNWREALKALATTNKGARPTLARSPMWRTPGDRPADVEDFIRLRKALIKLRIDGETLHELTRVALGLRKIGGLDTERVRVANGLRRLKLTRPIPTVVRDPSGGWRTPKDPDK